MLEPSIEKIFIDSADVKYQAAQALAQPIARASEALLACVTNGGKILVCGDFESNALAQYFTTCFVGKFERDRPGLAAICLGAGVYPTSSEGADESPGYALGRQVTAIGSPADVLLAITTSGHGLWQAIDAAHERDMIVIALTGADAVKLRGLLSDTDVQISVSHERSARVHEVHFLTLHCLCDCIDTMLLGDQESL